MLLQRKWLPFEDVKFVLGISPSTPEVILLLTVHCRQTEFSVEALLRAPLILLSLLSILWRNESYVRPRIVCKCDTAEFGQCRLSHAALTVQKWNLNLNR